MTANEKDKIFNSFPQSGFFGHPKGLSTLFFIEFWERFSYYGLKAILLYYMYTEISKGGLGLNHATSASILAIFGSLIYMSGIMGGWIADRLLGTTKTVFYGGILIFLGQIALSFPGGIKALVMAMVLVILGTGLLKPNVSSIVGDMYSEKDNRRDAGFSIFYMGINLGAFIAPLVVGTIGQKYNFHLGFSIAALGMFIGLIMFVVTKKKYLALAGSYIPNPLPPGESKKVFAKIGIGALVIILLNEIFILEDVLTFTRFTYMVSILGILIPAYYFVIMYRSPKTTKLERSRLIAYIPLFIAAMIFWAIQEQGPIILATFADKRTDLNISGVNIQSSWFQSINPLLIVVFAPLFAWIWVKLGNRQPSTSNKFALGMFFAGLSFLVMIVPVYLKGTETLVSPLWLVLSFFLVVLGELCLLPVGLSATTKLAPAAFSAQTMSLWFLSNASAQAINAQLVKMYTPGTEIMYFSVIGGISIILGGILFLFSPKIQSYMKGIS